MGNNKKVDTYRSVWEVKRNRNIKMRELDMNNFSEKYKNSKQDDKALFNAEIILVSVFLFYLTLEYLL